MTQIPVEQKVSVERICEKENKQIAQTVRRIECQAIQCGQRVVT